MMIPKEGFTDVTLIIVDLSPSYYYLNLTYLPHPTSFPYLTYLTNLTYLLIIATEVKTVKEIIHIL